LLYIFYATWATFLIFYDVRVEAYIKKNSQLLGSLRNTITMMAWLRLYIFIIWALFLCGASCYLVIVYFS